MNSSLALIYQDQIFQLLQDQKTTEAESLLQDAMEFNSDSSGLWFARAEIESRHMEYKNALDSARRAYSIDQWSGSSFSHFLQLYSELLDRLGMHEEYCEVFQDIQWNSAIDSNLLALYAESLRSSGKISAAIEAAEKGLSLFEDDPQFFTTLLAIDPQAYLFVFDDQWGTNPQVISEVVEPLLWIADEGTLLEFYLDKGADDWKKEFWKILFWDSETMETFLGKNEYVREMKYLASIYKNSDRASKMLLMDFLRQSQERFLWDQDNDGFSDAYLAFQDNHWLFQFDSDQDGAMEGSMLFSSDFVPEHFTKTLAEGYVEIDYHWPYIQDLTWNRSSKKLVYSFSRGSLKSLIPPVFSGDFLAYCEILEQLEWDMNEYELMSKSRNISEYYQSSILFRRYFLQNGRIFLVREDSDLNGKPDRLLQTDNWKPLAAIRDLDEDGSFDIYEYFYNGQWEGVFLDNNNDRVGDYIESWNPLELRIWDFNQDGFMDAGFNKEEKSAIIIRDEKERIPLDETLFWDVDFHSFWYQ